MHYQLLGFSQMGTIRTFWFHRIGPLGTAPVPVRVLADICAARRYNVALQELPSLCSRVLKATAADEPAGARIVGERDMSMYAADSETEFSDSTAEDLRVGRVVFIVGLRLDDVHLLATRVVVYENGMPVRMRPGTKIIMPDGTVRESK